LKTPGLTVVDHPLIGHHLTRLRDASTAPEEFRRRTAAIASLLLYEVGRTLPAKPASVVSPMGKARGSQLAREVVLVPVLRAGLGMLQPLLELLPNARVGCIGLKRDEHSLQPSCYQQSLPPDLGRSEVILLEPMLATGGSTVAALELLYSRRARKVRVLNLLAAPEGIRHVQKLFPDVLIFTAAVDRCLNDRGYIVPGLGDAGDRLLGV